MVVVVLLVVVVFIEARGLWRFRELGWTMYVCVGWWDMVDGGGLVGGFDGGDGGGWRR